MDGKSAKPKTPFKCNPAAKKEDHRRAGRINFDIIII
jgi:hypothetical protein